MQERAILAAGCFWGVEATLQKLDGVEQTKVGYTGGKTAQPDYKTVCSGTTGHAEAVEVLFNADIISYKKLLEHFWRLHDPTQMNRQGPDYGSQYRSAIFYTSEAQRQTAEESKQAAQQHHTQPIATEITAASEFWLAEDYHQCYVQKKSKFGFF